MHKPETVLKPPLPQNPLELQDENESANPGQKVRYK